jgi:2,6-dihydroxypseudooxynicotine hydrolase
MDQRKEIFVNPADNHYVKRGMNVLCFEGPGQGESAERKLYFDDPEKFGRGGKAAIDWLVKRKEVDPEKIGIYGNSMGSYWGSSVAIADTRVKALAVAMSCYYPNKGGIFTETTPNFRTRMMWMANKNTDKEWYEFLEGLTLEGKERLIKCPIIMFAGEQDHLCNIYMTYQFWKKLGSTIKELRIYAGQYHALSRFTDEFDLSMTPDFLRDRLLGKPVAQPAQKIVMIDNGKNEKSLDVEALEKGWALIDA